MFVTVLSAFQEFRSRVVYAPTYFRRAGLSIAQLPVLTGSVRESEHHARWEEPHKGPPARTPNSHLGTS